MSLHPKTQELLEMIPRYYERDYTALGVLESFGRELGRIEDMLNAIREKWFPRYADDEFNLLPYWERVLGLPVRPEGVPVGSRRDIVLAHLRKRRSGAATDWVDTISTALGSTNWTHQEGPGDYEVTIEIPYSAGSYNAAQVEQLARAITPAHLLLTAVYSQGFILGVSRVGVERL